MQPNTTASSSTGHHCDQRHPAQRRPRDRHEHRGGDDLPDRDHAGRAHRAEGVRAERGPDLVAERAAQHDRRRRAGGTGRCSTTGAALHSSEYQHAAAHEGNVRRAPGDTVGAWIRRCGSCAPCSPSSTPGPSPGPPTSSGVSQASVSRTVAALERALGARVLHRTTREVSLTAVGARVVGHARRVLEEVAAIRRAAEQARGELRIGYAWSALGRHTTAVQRRWSDAHPGSTLLVRPVEHPDRRADRGRRRRRASCAGRSATPACGRRCSASSGATPPSPPTTRWPAGAASAWTTSPGAPSPSTPSPGRRPRSCGPRPGRRPARGPVRGIEDWLTVIAAGQAVGMSSEATAAQHRRPGVVYRPVRDAPPVPVWLAWWADSPPPDLDALLQLLRAALSP